MINVGQNKAELRYRSKHNQLRQLRQLRAHVFIAGNIPIANTSK